MPQTNIFADDRMNAIYEVQHYLRFLSKYMDEIPTVTPDGIFGRETEDAVREFQRLYLLPVSGEVDLDTWNLLREIYLIFQEASSPASPVHVYPIELDAMKLGDEYNEVYILQTLLKKLSDRYSNIPVPETTGYFSPQTEEIIMILQEIFGLEKTGRVDKKTWNRIAKLYSISTFND